MYTRDANLPCIVIISLEHDWPYQKCLHASQWESEANDWLFIQKNSIAGWSVPMDQVDVANEDLYTLPTTAGASTGLFFVRAGEARPPPCHAGISQYQRVNLLEIPHHDDLLRVM